MIHVAEHHDIILHLWRKQNFRGIRLAHVDFHDDLRGLLIDRGRGRAWPIGLLANGTVQVDTGNFLAHAVLEGRLEKMRWMHDLPGGRAWDVGIVRYTSDLFALPHTARCLLSGQAGYPFRFCEILIEKWNGLEADECLSLDWDCFASVLQDPGGIDRRVQRFLNRIGTEIPPETYMVYSPEYCHPSLDAFLELVAELERRFHQSIQWLSPHLFKKVITPLDIDPRLPRNPLTRLLLALRRIGIC